MELKTIISEFRQSCVNARSEDDIKRGCNIFFYNIGELFNININTDNERTSIHGGRADSIYNDVIFELKKLNLFSKSNQKGIDEAIYGRNNKDHGLFHYLINFSLESSNSDVNNFRKLLFNKIGIGFDGMHFVFCRFKDSDGLINIFHKEKTKKIPDDFPHEIRGEFEVSQVFDFENGIKRILLYIRSTKRKVLTSQQLYNSFNSKSVITQQVIPYLYTLLNKSLNSNRRIETLYNEWDRIFGTIYEKQESDFVKHVTAIKSMYNVEEINGEIDVKKALFVIQTYYSIMIKLLIQNLFASLKLPTNKTDIVRDSSDLFALFHGKKNNFSDYIDNFFEFHFFEWFTLAEDFEINHINNIITELDNFETTASVIKPEIVGDVLKQTYESLMPKALRHLMGEYYTVEWLVDFTIEKSGYQCGIDESVLDPTCGSCIFITHLIKRYIAKYSKTLSYNNLVNHIVDNFVGFDINPIAVIQSKGNYILSLGDITQLDAPMSIPIYMCDSILVPTVHAKQKENGNIIEIETSVGKFILPILKDRIESDKFLKTLSTCILNDYSTFEEFEGRLQNEEDIELKEEDRQIARKLFCQLQVLHSCSKDGFWPIILKNSFAPLFSKKHFDYVMGNPPWIAWKAMSESYRKLTLDIWLSYGIFEKSAYDKKTSHDDFAMAVVYVCIDHYLKNSGVASFVLPQTFVKSLKGGEGFRKFCITRDGHNEPFSIEAVFDMLQINPFKGIATNKTSVYVLKKSIPMTYPMDNYFECKLLNPIQNSDGYNNVLQNLYMEQKSAKPINDDIRSPWLTMNPEIMHNLNFYLGTSEYRGRKGIEPCGAKGVYLINILGKRRDKVYIENLVERSRLQAVKDKGVHRGLVDKDFIYPMVGGRNIDKWGLNSSIYMIVPHDNKGSGIYRGYDESKLKSEYGLTYDWLHYFHDILLKTRIKSGKFFNEKEFPWYRLDNVGEYTFKPYKVLWKEQSVAMNCCVVSTLDDKYLGKKTVVTDSKVLFVSFDNELEAYYLCGILNSSEIEEIIKSYTINTNRGVDIVKNIKIPTYDANNEYHNSIANFSKCAHLYYEAKNEIKIKEYERLINEMVPKVFIKE